MTNDFRHWLRDTSERVVFTFVEAFIGLLVVDATNMVGGISLSVVEHAFASAVVASLAVVKSALAARRAGMSPASFVSHN